MNNCNLLINKNNDYSRRVKLVNNDHYYYAISNNTINITEIKKIVSFLYSIKKRHNIALSPIVIDLKNSSFEDKLSFIILECICYDLFVLKNCKLTLHFKCDHTIRNEGIKYSCLKYVNGTKEGRNTFFQKFNSDIDRYHFRRIIKKDDGITNISFNVQDINNFFKIVPDAENREAISLVIGELIDNAIEHSQSDCLIDLDITRDYTKNNTPQLGCFYGVNITVVDLSEKLFGDDISYKISLMFNNTIEAQHEREKAIIKAFQYHAPFWDNNYNQTDFMIITAFQHRITGRIGHKTGGTGLTSLIKALEDKSDAYNCYMITGYNKINFIKDYLLYNSDEWVGFNLSKDYVSDVPNKLCIDRSALYFPGTAYNLNFVLKREVIDGTTKN